MERILFMTVITACLFGVFMAAYKRRRFSLYPAISFAAFFISTFLTLIMIGYNVNHRVAEAVMLAVAFVLLFFFFFGSYIFIALLYINARLVLKRERRTVANCLTLILAVGLTVFVVASLVIPRDKTPAAVGYFLSASNVVILYYAVHVTLYIVSIMLCNISRPKARDYVVVLGCWLKDGNVTPLLAARVDRAIAFYNKQAADATPPTIIMSGGQGADEARSEAAAMRDYAISKGVPPEHIITEDRSVSTKENMLFSKAIMEERSQGSFTCVFVTSNYHVMRAGIYARRAKLTATGLGAKTAPYYLPNAVLREYIAYLVMYRRRNIAVCAVIYAAAVVFSVLYYAFEWHILDAPLFPID